MLRTRAIIWGLLFIGSAAAIQVNINPTHGGKYLGETIYFRCNVVGEAKEITWYDPKGRTIEPDDPDLYVTRDGQTSDIVIQRITLLDTGLYKCVAKNDDTEAEATATLEVFQKITFQNAPGVQTFNEGEDAEIICDVVSTPPPEVFWRYQNSKILYDLQPRFHQLSNNHLRISAIQKADEGTYSCEARVVQLGELAFKPITVRVNERTNHSEAMADDGVTMTCAGSVDPTRICTSCNLGGKKFPAGTESPATLSSLVFENFHFTNAGQYRCTPTNLGAQNSQILHLAFQYAPKISGEGTVYTLEGKAANISCEVDAFPAALVVWYRSGVQLPSSPDHNMTNIKVYYTPDGSYLEVTPDSQKDFGNYTCTASNAVGIVSKVFLLAVAGVPSSPKILHVEPFAKKAVVVFTQPEFSGGMPVIHYRVIRRFLGKRWVISHHPAEENMTRITIEDLKPETTYEISMTAGNLRGPSAMSPPVSFKTRSVGVPSPPKIQLIDPSITSAVMVFSEPECSGGLPIAQYRVEYLLQDQSWNSRLYTFEKSMTRITLDNLKPDTTYMAKMAAVNHMGVSEWTPTITFKTKPVELPLPPQIRYLETDSTTAVVAFTEPESTGGLPITKYNVQWRVLGEDWHTRVTATDGNLTQITIDDLIPGATYELSMSAFNQEGASPRSPSVTFKMESLD